MQFNMSSTKELIKIELTIPRKSLRKHDSCNGHSYKQGTAKELRREDIKDISIDTVHTNASLKSSSNILSQSQAHENTNHTPERLTPQEMKNLPRKGLESKKISNPDIHQFNSSTKSIHQLPSSMVISLRSKALPEEIKPTESCVVCGDETSKFNHYGGRSCLSCRAFFRRTVGKLNRYVMANTLPLHVNKFRTLD